MAPDLSLCVRKIRAMFFEVFRGHAMEYLLVLKKGALEYVRNSRLIEPHLPMTRNYKISACDESIANATVR